MVLVAFEFQYNDMSKEAYDENNNNVHVFKDIVVKLSV